MKSAPTSKHRYPGDNNSLLAITSPLKIAVIGIFPVPRILFRATWSQLLESEENLKSSNSQASWWLSPRVHGSLDHDKLLLALSFGHHLRILHIYWNTGDSTRKLRFEIVAQGKSPSDIVSLNWLGSKHLAAITSNHDCHIFDTMTLATLESSSMGIPNLSFFQLKTRIVFNNCISLYRNHLFFLTTKGVQFCGLKKWQDRLSLIMSNDYKYAIELGIEFYKGNPSIAVLGLPLGTDARQKSVGEYLVDKTIAKSSLMITTTKIGGNIDQLMQSCDFAFYTCISIGKENILLEMLWDQYSSSGFPNVFLEVFKTWIIRGEISISPSMEILKRMINLFNRKEIEDVLLNLNLSKIDIKGVLALCIEKRMVNPTLHFYSVGLGEFVSPILEVLHFLQIKGVGTVVEDLNPLFTYMAGIFNGTEHRAKLQSGTTAKLVSEELLKFLFSERYISFTSFGTTTSQQLRLGEQPWPYIRFLITMDTPKMMGVLKDIYAIEILANGIRWQSDDSEMSRAIDRQFLSDVLMDLKASNKLSSIQNDYICSFAATCFGVYRESVDLSVGEQKELFESLISSGIRETLEGREAAVLHLHFSSPKLFSSASHLAKAKDAGFWNFYRILALENHHYDLALNSFLHDSKNLPSTLESWLNDAKIKGESEISIIKEAIVSNFHYFIEKKIYSIIETISNHFPEIHLKLLEAYDMERPTSFEYLNWIVENETDKVKELVFTDSRNYMTYLKLICKFKPERVYKFLVQNDDQPVMLMNLKNNAEEIQAIFHQHKTFDALVWALIRLGNIDSGMEIALNHVEELILEAETTQDTFKLFRFTRILFSLLQTSSKHAEYLWFKILENMCFSDQESPVRQIVERDALQAVFINVGVHKILVHLIAKMETPSFKPQISQLSIFLEQILGEIEEKSIVLELARDAQSKLLSEYVLNSGSSRYNQSNECPICKNSVVGNNRGSHPRSENLVIFPCNHCFHENCATRMSHQILKSGPCTELW